MSKSTNSSILLNKILKNNKVYHKNKKISKKMYFLGSNQGKKCNLVNFVIRRVFKSHIRFYRLLEYRINRVI